MMDMNELREGGIFRNTTIMPEHMNSGGVFQVAKAFRGLKILDVGMAGRMNANVGSGSLYIGVDPLIGPNDRFKLGVNKIGQGARVVAFESKIDELQVFNTDLLICVAPNPENIVEDGLLYDLEGHLKKARHALFVFDKRTFEAKGYGKEAVDETIKMLRSIGKKPKVSEKNGMAYSSNGGKIRGKLNSRDLGRNNIWIRY